MYFSFVKSAFLNDNNFAGVFAGEMFLFNSFPVCSVFIKEYDVFSFFNMLFTDDKQDLIIGMINSLSPYW